MDLSLQGRGAALLAVGVLVALGTAGGVGAGIATTDAPVVSAPDTPVPFSICPDSGEAGTFHRGDRVLTTGRDGSGDWYEVRDPGDLQARVWVEAQYVVPDGSTHELPVTACRPSGPDSTLPESAAPIGPADATAPDTTAAIVPTNTPTTSTSSTAPTTTRPSVTTTETTPATTSSTTAPAASTTTPVTTSTTNGPPDKIAPTVTGVAVQPTQPDTCSRTTVSAEVADNVGVQTVTAQWTYEGKTRTTMMTLAGGSTYSATLGNPLGGNGGPLSVTVTGRDAGGNTASASTSSTVVLC